MNTKIGNSTFLASMLWLAVSSSFAQNNDILAQQFFIKIQTTSGSIYPLPGRIETEILIKDPTSPQAKALVTSVASYFGVPESSVGIALTTAFESSGASGSWESYYINVPAPQGYTICYATPLGESYHGVESSEDSTFNAVIRRPVPASQFDGLAMYLIVPVKMSSARAMATFNIIFVKYPPDWQRYPQCRPTGEAAWLSRNNDTRLNWPCPQRDLCAP
jgi:hypothetical protein